MDLRPCQAVNLSKTIFRNLGTDLTYIALHTSVHFSFPCLISSTLKRAAERPTNGHPEKMENEIEIRLLRPKPLRKVTFDTCPIYLNFDIAARDAKSGDDGTKSHWTMTWRMFLSTKRAHIYEGGRGSRI